MMWLLLVAAWPLWLLCAQLLAALPRPRVRAPPTGPRPPLAVLVPAHNEAMGIGATLAAIRRQLAATDLLLVVADNCDDDTASIARTFGATVIERHAPQQRGKAYALAYGLRWLTHCGWPQVPAAATPILICIDADCTPGQHALDYLADRCATSQRPAQARYLMHAGAPVTPPLLVAEFAWRVKNQLRALGRHRLRMACQLTGSGMAFPWPMLPNIDPAHHLTEDLMLGLQLAAQGYAPVYCHHATIHSYFAHHPDGANAQRQRWEHGHLHLLLTQAPRHLISAIRRRDWRHASLALDLCIPPLSLLLMLTAAAALLALPMLAIPPVLTLLLTWAIHGRDLLPLAKLPSVLPYMLKKIPLYLRKRQRDWIRTERD